MAWAASPGSFSQAYLLFASTNNHYSNVIDHPVCPCCGNENVYRFYSLREIPVHSVLLMRTRETALAFPKGDIHLGYCQSCGFIYNTSFQPEKLAYSPQYEETQGFSGTFHTFHVRLASQLIERYSLRNKTIIEIGCGKGEFLTMLCELGENRGIGFDPAYVPERMHSPAKERLTFITDFYSEKYAGYAGDFYCCKMTLEHIRDAYEFVRTLRRAIGDRPDAVVFVQVPEITRILRENAFWDIYYEHCSYFSPGSLARLFRRAGFEVVDLWKDYDDQYLMLAGKPLAGKPAQVRPGRKPPDPGSSILFMENDLDELEQRVRDFSTLLPARLEGWRQKLAAYKEDGRHVALWGGGSKGVAFLTTIQSGPGTQIDAPGKTDRISAIGCVVDINPYKKGTFLPGTGHEIALPEQLKNYRPDVVIVMNPVYCQEIRNILEEMDLFPELIPANISCFA